MKRPIRSLAIAASLAMSAAASAAAPPTTTGPNNPNPPGAFPTTVTAANINVAILPGSIHAGAGSDDMKVTFPSAGPIKWTSPRFNEGDLALSIGPFDPADPSYYPPDAHGVFQPGSNEANPFTNATLAWRLNQQTGATLVTTRTNGYTPDITFNGQAVGTLHGSAYASTNGAAQGWGYRMNDGAFANGGEGSLDILMGVAGYDEGTGESAFDIATAYFPYEQGWKGAWVNGGNGTTNEAIIAAGHPDFIGSTVATWQADDQGSFAFGNGRVVLPGIDSANDGMLFVAPSSDSSGNSTHIAAGAPRDGGWDVTVREDQGDGLGQFPIHSASSSSYQFLYVPYDADGLVGGMIDGDTGSLVKGGGQSKFFLYRRAEGEYGLSVFKPTSSELEKKTGDDGMLVLSVASHDETVAAGNVAARTMLSYEFDAESGDFIIQSRIDAAITGGTSVFGDLLALTDTDFYFSWIDFNSPMTPDPAPQGIPGDTNGDGNVDLEDLNAVRNNFGGTGEVGSTAGDAYPFNGVVDLEDLNAVRNNFGATSNPVPEPATWCLGLVGLAVAALVRRRRS
jgi:MYXO-CTERM domain-containing protein